MHNQQEVAVVEKAGVQVHERQREELDLSGPGDLLYATILGHIEGSEHTLRMPTEDNSDEREEAVEHEKYKLVYLGAYPYH